MINKMESTVQNQIAFFLTGRRDPTLQALDENVRPALFARYGDLASLRYDLPLILNRDAAPQWAVLSLSHLVDQAVESIGSSSESLRVARHGYRLECELRRQLCSRGRMDLATAWKTAAQSLSADGDEEITASADLLWNSFQANGEVVDAGAELPGLTIRHAWASVQADKARAFRRKADQLSHVLRGILASEAMGSAAGRAPARLRAGVGSSFADTFDFDTMSDLLGASKPEVRLTDERRLRITHLLEVLERQRFYPLKDNGSEPYPYAFESCAEALAAYNERYPSAVELTKTLAVAELEAAGEYRESIHDLLFDSFGANGLDRTELGQLPDYLICTDGISTGPAEMERLLQLLAAGVPFKILLQTDDVFEPSGIAKGSAAFASRARSIVNAAIGMTDVYVMQISASQLFRQVGSMLSGLIYDGPALFSIFSGANVHNGDVPPYLVAAAATEARVFPTLIYDPSKGETSAERTDVSANPQPDNDWPIHLLSYERANVETVSEIVAFTAADFMAMDRRFAGHFALVPNDRDADTLLTISEALSLEVKGLPEKVPFVPLVEVNGQLHLAVIDDRTLQDVHRCLRMWRGLKVSGAGGDIASLTAAEEPILTATASSSGASEITASDPAAKTSSEAEAEVDRGDDPYIETERCTTCNECTNLNNRMFAYNENKQAFIADPDAGTFRQLVDAAEGCQVSIIHPGKPRNAKEPGLEDLLLRAAEFN